jgi:hypothetical protein
MIQKKKKINMSINRLILKKLNKLNSIKFTDIFFLPYKIWEKKYFFFFLQK